MPETTDDAIWVGRCLRGDPAAFEPLVLKYQRVLFAVAYRLVGDYEDARDVTQNALVRAFERLDQYDPQRRFFSWIYRIAVNESLNLRRSRRGHDELPATLAVVGGQPEALARIERGAIVQAAIARLPREYREVVVLRHFAELSYEDIGEATGVPAKTVKSRLFSARQRLQAMLAAGKGDY
jgi:RNA polymerase sigma-70 factor (ECF subfamily)